MLPGLRLLFAITLLSISVLIFGLGAAAFLRSAHESFANAPWQPINTPATARVDLAPPSLAMLRVEPEAAPASSAQPIDPPPAIPVPAKASVAPEPAIATPVEANMPPEPVLLAPVAAVPPPSTVQAETETASESTASPPAPTPPAQASAPQPAPASPIAETPSGPPPSDAGIAVAKARDGDAKEAPAPVVATLDPGTGETAIKAEPIPAAPPGAAEHPAPDNTASGADTLQDGDKTVGPKSTVTASGEPAQATIAPIPAKDVKIPNPRVDPTVVEARRQQLRAQRRARARAIRVRRLAAARARAAAAKAANNPFGVPTNTTSAN